MKYSFVWVVSKEEIDNESLIDCTNLEVYLPWEQKNYVVYKLVETGQFDSI